ncbi:MAG: efflux RND transporter periplasmic adaptor subunit [Verrucomicrobiota bacterium]
METENQDLEKGAPRDSRSRGRGKWILLGFLFVGVVLFLLRGPRAGADDVGGVSNQEGGMRVLAVEIVPVVLQDMYDVQDRFVGRVEAARSSALGFELPGTVEMMSVDDGMRVETGDVLARLDTARLEARRGELVASLEQFQASRDLADQTLKRTQEAVGKGAVSLQEGDEAAERLRTGEAVVRRAEAQLEAIDVDLAKSELLAPYAGTIAAREVDEGAIVSAGQTVLRLLETGRLEVRVGLSSVAAGEVSVGDPLNMVCSDGETIDGEVMRILPQRDVRVRTVEVVVGLPESEGSVVRDGDLLEVIMARQVNERGAWLPRSALTESARGLWGAYVVEPDGSLHVLERRQVEVIDESGDEVYVRGALRDGEAVVASGLHRLSPRQRVRVLNLPGGEGAEASGDQRSLAATGNGGGKREQAGMISFLK